MSSTTNQTDFDRDFPGQSEDISSTQTKQDVSVEPVELTATETEGDRIELPQPDAENITVLTDKLPNKPILPWNRYDSPWEGSEEDQAISSELTETEDPNCQTDAIANEEQPEEADRAIESESNNLNC